ncbi:hypothetical protein CDV55_108889 [Aspergillus turcosus]|nr:hypothetical protein CDV55_108889 [Aspergillus turcosus]
MGFLAINTAQGWQGAASPLAAVCPDYDQAMNYLVHALVQRLQHVGRGKSRYLDPGIVDIQTAIDLYKEDPSRPPVASEVLAGLGVRRNPMGLLSTGAEIIEAPIGDPGFDEHEDAENIEDAQTPPATTVEPAATPSTSTTATVLGEASTHTATIKTSARRRPRCEEAVKISVIPDSAPGSILTLLLSYMLSSSSYFVRHPSLLIRSRFSPRIGAKFISTYYNLFGSNGLQGVRIHIVDSFALSEIVELSTY